MLTVDCIKKTKKSEIGQEWPFFKKELEIYLDLTKFYVGILFIEPGQE